MKPGRELDALIAEKVMGLVIADLKPLGINAWGEPECIPFYSTDIAAAWEIVEKLASPGFYVTLNESHRLNGSSDWAANFGVEGWPGYGERYGETAPHAICLAALKAVGYEANG